MLKYFDLLFILDIDISYGQRLHHHSQDSCQSEYFTQSSKKLKVRSQITRYFTYCVKQAKGCADQLSSDLLKMKIVTHLYGKNKISSNKH